MRRYWHIKMNPSKINGNTYNEIVRKYPLPNQLKIDFVYNVKDVEIKELTREQFNKL